MQRAVALAIIFALAAALASTSPAAAPEQSRQTYTAKFTSRAPGASTGLQQEIHYRNPGDPGGKPYAVQRIAFALPNGSMIDTSVPAQCKASEPQFQSSGAEACPVETRVGDGSLVADTGFEAGAFPRLIETDVTFFNNRDELILFAESTSTPGPPIRVVSRIDIREQRLLVSTVPPLPGAPPPEPYLAIKDVVNNLDELTVGAQPYIKTPPRCPRSGHWTITATFTYRDGTVESVDSQTPCKVRAGARDTKAPRIRVRGVPRRGCTTDNFRVRVRVADNQSGLRRSRLSLDGRRLIVTAKKRFSWRINASELRAGRHQLKVVAFDNIGNRSTKRKLFHSCGEEPTPPTGGCDYRSLRFAFAIPLRAVSC